MTSFSMHGVGVSSGIAIGHAHLISHALLEVVHFKIDADGVADEIARFERAVDLVKQDLEQLKAQLPKNAPAELGAFINTHLAMLSDKSLSEAPKATIRNEQCNAEWALKQQMDDIVAQFDAIEDAYLRERKQDVVQVVERVIKVLLGRDQLAASEKKTASQTRARHDSGRA